MRTIETELKSAETIRVHPNQRLSVDGHIMKILESRDWAVTGALLGTPGQPVSLEAINRLFRVEGQLPYSSDELRRLIRVCTPSSEYTSVISQDGSPPDVRLWIAPRVEVTRRPVPIPDIVVAHREGIARQGISVLIEQGSKVKVVGTAGNYDELPKVLAHTRPDVLLTTTDLPSEQVNSPSSQLERIARELRVVVITPTYKDPMMGVFALSHMAPFVSAFIDNEDYKELVKGIVEAHLGQRYVSQRLLRANSLDTKEQFYELIYPFQHGKILGFSSRELHVIALLGRGLTNKDIASILFITQKTVEAHRSNILSKAVKVSDHLRSHTLTSMTRLALDLGLIRPEDIGSG